ncbi:HipA domain-containing protein [Myroides marinus]|uniref:HipA domain-containing protein n=1 Tax=Myroides marinus TaxID=703342 RepID=UPI002577C39B|nr:HipA domain-containing protein [Myroides marinus]MDM1369887.1 HipA domain-containing protein [Myroides marinus]MDM1372546.1 HipA domain-containing protein [Myroides marinus]MDM1376796.1 HipA domain-containing protein [Myroides marinus]MDM1384115.1 HipA domain-containing protein [Myroides marinus]MDM1389448.1 HipA domain-containing protein [Myroides marinus]
MSRCLYCYEALNEDATQEYHEHCAKAFYGSTEAPMLTYKMSEMTELAKEVVERSVTVPGVQPKLSMGIIDNSLKDAQGGRMTILDALEGLYILKPQNENYTQMPENEHLSMRLAELFGIKVVPSSLIRMGSGGLCYITKRVDRTNENAKLHMIDFLQILELEDKYLGTMEQVGKEIGELSDYTMLDKVRFFELSVFNFIIGNNDMHLKNFSMLCVDGVWQLSPAYDLLNVKIVLPADEDDFALNFGGKKKNQNRVYFERFGEVLKLNKKQVLSVLSRLEMWSEKADELIEQSFLSEDLKEKYRIVLKTQLEKMN